MNRQTAVEARCVAVADILVPNYRNGSRAYSCAGHVAKMWQAAYDGAAAVLADPLPADVRRLVIAARKVTDCGTDEDETRELFDAVEAFSSRVPYEEEPDDMADASVPDRLARRMGAEFVTRDAAPPVEGLTSGGDMWTRTIPACPVSEETADILGMIAANGGTGEIGAAAVAGVDTIWGCADPTQPEQGEQIERARGNIVVAIRAAVAGITLVAGEAPNGF